MLRFPKLWILKYNSMINFRKLSNLKKLFLSIVDLWRHDNYLWNQGRECYWLATLHCFQLYLPWNIYSAKIVLFSKAVIFSAYLCNKNVMDSTRICEQYRSAAPADLLAVRMLGENDGAISNCAEHITSAERWTITEITMYLFLHYVSSEVGGNN
jgi:hypothetical protein